MDVVVLRIVVVSIGLLGICSVISAAILAGQGHIVPHVIEIVIYQSIMFLTAIVILPKQSGAGGGNQGGNAGVGALPSGNPQAPVAR